MTLGLWGNFKEKPENINEIVIQDYLNKEPLILKDTQRPMGYVAYNQEILNKAKNKLRKSSSLIENFEIPLNKILLVKKFEFKNDSYEFKKIILCLGKNFNLPQFINKISFHSKHKSFVGFFDHSKNHNNIAYELFTKNGPLAVLPAPKINKKHSTFIFSTKQDLSKIELDTLLKKYFKDTHGSIKLLPKISSFNIYPHISNVLNNNYILMGDMLRSIHPVAGQGWNLGIKDIQTLCDLLIFMKLTIFNLDKIYNSKRLVESSTYLGFTSTLNKMYENESPISSLIIRSVYQTLLKVGFVRNSFIKQAMGELNLVG
jgi:2-octaprenyl-6-methoxyphenol hydroxylase